MKEERFNKVMHAVDDDLLEEAKAPRKRSNLWWKITAGAVAACLCIAAVSILAQNKADNTQNTGAQLANPMVTAADIAALGYSLPVPADAQETTYTTIDQGTDSSVPIAQVKFLENGQEYTCRTLKAQSATDISGLHATWTDSLDWTAGTLQLQLRQSSDENAAWFGWYSPKDSTQWCISGPDGDGLALLHTAQEIVDSLGYEMEVAPDQAQDVCYNAFKLNGLTVAETAFTLNGTSYAYRTAATADTSTDFADISGKDDTYAVSATAKVGYCSARLYYTEGGSGKIVWFDVVPGLLYSVSMSDGASQSALLDMANQLFTPAQGDVG